MGKFGGKEKSPATVYPVQIDNDQKVYVLLEGNQSNQLSSSSSVTTASGGSKAARATMTSSLSTNAMFRMDQRPRPIDTNICLSLLDKVLSSGSAGASASATTSSSKTTELNVVANCVSRAMLYGTKRDKDDIASRLDDMAEAFPR